MKPLLIIIQDNVYLVFNDQNFISPAHIFQHHRNSYIKTSGKGTLHHDIYCRHEQRAQRSRFYLNAAAHRSKSGLPPTSGSSPAGRSSPEWRLCSLFWSGLPAWSAAGRSSPSCTRAHSVDIPLGVRTWRGGVESTTCPQERTGCWTATPEVRGRTSKQHIVIIFMGPLICWWCFFFVNIR